MLQYGLEWHALDTYFQMVEVASAPGTPEANNLRLYAKDQSSVSALFYKDDAGNEINLSGGLTGTGSANAIAYWTGATTLDDEAAWTFNTTTHALTLNAAGQHSGLNLLSGGATNRSALNLGRTTTETTLAIAGGSGEFSDIVTAGGESVLRNSLSHLIISARNASGEIKFATGAADTEKFRIGSAGQWGIGGATYGTARQVFQSNGSAAAPSWSNNFGEQLAVMLGGM